MESESVCPTCLQVFTDTAQLPCGHTFCRECVSKTETLAQNAYMVKACLICSANYRHTPMDTPHQCSIYHDKLVSLCDPKKKRECSMCDEQPFLVCEDGCGLLCEDCHDKHHSVIKATRKHSVK
jgi:hypothetical protein